MATDIGTRIKRARERKRWTQRKLAGELQVSIKTVDNWENGRTSPKNRLGAIEEVLGIRLAGDAPPPVPEDLRRDIMRNENISDEEKADILAAVEARLRVRAAPGPSAPGAGPGRLPPASRSGDRDSGHGERGNA